MLREKTRREGNFLYGREQSVFTDLYSLYNDCYTAHIPLSGHSLITVEGQFIQTYIYF